MIGRIRGILAAKHPPEIVVDVGGVGYEIQVPMTTLFQLPDIGTEVSLVTHFVVREDAQQLFGFVSEVDRRLFRELIKVSGVGPRLALTLLSGMDAREFSRCLQRDDVASLVALPGVGKKTAERLLVEMRDKAGKWLGELSPEMATTVGVAPGPAPDDAREEAEQALVALGYKLADASRLVASVDDSGASSEQLIRRALQAAAPRSQR
ncbi:Holliday junction DNA helicase RuvA [Luminiphilus syltensis NOR5-1B]|uniref:Holliday junction branch migration complex subunit RuvA n=1 Tax=Luminiphilus syltensis NOR5-1B TaxID=565045 RepID=B8KS66_9GAMM|nr:Holliday junction branch migration protein RuvA [Luminiphilus syltensis]EED34231.1 Holliday junction DNA helicase RuvA [Luminiphilus syltensis NOR5-1B]